MSADDLQLLRAQSSHFTQYTAYNTTITSLSEPHYVASRRLQSAFKFGPFGVESACTVPCCLDVVRNLPRATVFIHASIVKNNANLGSTAPVGP